MCVRLDIRHETWKNDARLSSKCLEDASGGKYICHDLICHALMYGSNVYSVYVSKNIFHKNCLKLFDTEEFFLFHEKYKFVSYYIGENKK